jgi:glutaminyl-tRNA synthetase
MEVPVKKWFRLAPGTMVRLKSAYIVTCEDFKKDANGNITEIHCSYIPESKSGHDHSGFNVKGTIHWVSVPHAVPAEIRLYDRLFKVEDPGSEEGDFKDFINPDSLNILTTVFVEPSLKNAKLEDRYQFIRKGYYCLDPDSTNEKLIFNRTVTLKDAWAKEVKKK